VISRGEELFELDGGPGPALFYGSRPMWRTLSNGVSDGVDVLQLEQNLAALGFTDSGNMTVDSHFSAATASAISAWQLARGVTQTGSVTPSDVVYDSGPVRVSAYVAAVGDSASGTIYDVTGTARSVHVDLDPANQAYAIQGAHVSVTLPDGNNVDGVIASIGTVATVTSSSGNGGGGGGGGGSSTTTIPVTIVVPKQPKDALDESPVTVNLVTSRARKVLTVPVNALLALAEGGYALEKVNADGTTTLVKITVGMFASGFVEVTGSVSEGETVVSA
jgi:peptidoglycan hydrolase-like protein with peptidoglycan-binding domain